MSLGGGEGGGGGICDNRRYLLINELGDGCRDKESISILINELGGGRDQRRYFNESGMGAVTKSRRYFNTN